MANAFFTPSRGHLANCVGDHRVPVAIAPIDGQIYVVFRQFNSQRVDQAAALFVDRADPAQIHVSRGDLFESCARHSAPSSDVVEEGHDVIGALRATK